MEIKQHTSNQIYMVKFFHFDNLPINKLNKIHNNTPINADQGVLIKEIFKQKPRPLGYIGIIDIKLAYDIHPDANTEY